MTNTSEMTPIQFKTYENRLRRRAERQGYMLVKSPRRDPRAPGYRTYMLIPDNRPTVWDYRDPDIIAKAHQEMDQGNGLTAEQVDAQLDEQRDEPEEEVTPPARDHSLWNWVEPEQRWAYITNGDLKEVKRLRRLFYAIAKPDCAFAIRKGANPPELPPKYVTVAGEPAPGFKAATKIRGAS